MTRRSLCVIALLAVAAASVPTGAERGSRQGTPQQTFRAAADAVMVDVSVRVDGRMVAGLTAADFDLRDNGVRQRVDTIEAAAVPIDLTLVVDVSGNPHGAWTPVVDPLEAAKSPSDDLRRIATILRPDDRVRMLAIDTYLSQPMALQPISSAGPIRFPAAGGMASFYDTLIAALLLPVDPDRRHVVVLSSKGRDTVSATGVDAVVGIAEQSDVQLHAVMQETAAYNEDDVVGFQCEFIGLCTPVRRFWRPHFARSFVSANPGTRLTESGRALAEAAQRSGGDVYLATMISEPTMVGTFQRAFENFRQSYILRYTPQNVKREGWHELAVTVPSHPHAVVRARRGYAIERLDPSRTTPSATPSSATTYAPTSAATSATPPRSPESAAEFVAAFDRGDFDVVRGTLLRTADPTSLIRDFRDADNPWPDEPTREAAFVLELAESGLFSRRDSARSEARALLDAYTRFVRHPLEPDEFERQWHAVVLTMAVGMVRPDEAQLYVRRALDRFPEEPRFLLSRAIVADQRSRQRTAPGQPPLDAEVIAEAYQPALASAATVDEARVRLAWLLHRAGRSDDALVHLDAIDEGRSPDTPMRYWRHLVRGQALESLDRLSDAAGAYRAALRLVPDAQSARVGLMNVLLQTGEREEALALAERVQTAPANAPDPWGSYWLADQRFFQSAIARLRGIRR